MKVEYYQPHSAPIGDDSCNSAGSYYSGGSGGIKHMSKLNRNRQVVQQQQQFDYHHQSPTDLCTSPAVAQSISNDTFSISDKQRPNIPVELSSEASAATTARCGSTTTESHVSNSAGCASNGRSRSRDRRRHAINITSNPGYQVGLSNSLTTCMFVQQISF